MTATMLLASELKKEERIQLRMDGNGPLKSVIAEANSLGEVRGYVADPTAELDYTSKGVSLGDGIGLGVLSLTKVLYNEAEAHFGHRNCEWRCYHRCSPIFGAIRANSVCGFVGCGH